MRRSRVGGGENRRSKIVRGLICCPPETPLRCRRHAWAIMVEQLRGEITRSASRLAGGYDRGAGRSCKQPHAPCANSILSS